MKHASKLHQIILNDPEIRLELAKITNKEECIDLIVNAGEKHGTPVTAAQVSAYLHRAAQDVTPSCPSQELTDTDLEQVVGGKEASKAVIDTVRSIQDFIINEDDLKGTDKGDNMDGRWGNDTMDGQGGNDTMYGGDGEDSMKGGAGDDSMWGGRGHDTIEGGSGNDFISAEHGNDFVYGGDGNDTIEGGQGNDFIEGGAGNDSIDGGWDNDLILGGDGDDFIKGGQGNDTLGGGFGNDTLLGGSGDDLFYHGVGNNLLDGGEGNDSISSGDGNDTMIGGSGNDTFIFDNDSGNNHITDFTYGQDKFEFTGTGNPSMTHENGNTIITFGHTTITLDGVELTEEQLKASLTNQQ